MPTEALATTPSRIPRAEFILATAIAVVSVLVLALTFALRAEDPAHARTVATIVVARGVRDETLALTQAMVAAEASRGDMLAGIGNSIGMLRARFDAHARVAKLRAIASGDNELTQQVTHIAQIVEADFARDDIVLAGSATAHTPTRELDDAVTALIETVNRRNDIARGAENRLRDRLDAISIALGFLTLFASGLAILSLRRERRRWLAATELSESARAKAAASDLAKTRFLAAASHDMRQPLHALTLYLSALRKRVREAEPSGILANAERAAQSLVSMFAVLLDLARIEANVVVPEFASVALQEAFERIGAEHPGADIAIGPTPLAVRSDPVLLDRMLRNLTANALRHGGGSARLSARGHGEDVEILVQDDGPGIAPEDQARIFEEFVRIEGASSEGLGLGLSIVQRLASLMDHEIELVSQPGQGATFVVRAPRAAAAIASPTQIAQHPVSLSGVDALVIDDDPLARGAMSRALEDLGARVTACANEAELSAALAASKPELVIVDLRLNGRIVGLELAAQIEREAGYATKIVMVTGDTAADTLAALRASGRRWLIKPVDPLDLAAAVRPPDRH